MEPMGAESFQQLRVLSLLALALLFAPSVVPPIRPFGRQLRIAALLLYLAGGLAILARWLLTRT